MRLSKGGMCGVVLGLGLLGAYALAVRPPAPEPAGDVKAAIEESHRKMSGIREAEVARARHRYEVSRRSRAGRGRSGPTWRATYDLALALVKREELHKLHRDYLQISHGPVSEEPTRLIEDCQSLARTEEEQRLTELLVSRVQPQTPIGQ